MNIKKITLIGGSLAGGGSERVNVAIANSFAERGWEVDLVILNLNNQAYLNHISKRVNLIILKVNHIRYSALSLLNYFFKKKPKIVIVFSNDLTLIVSILRFLFKLKIKIIARNHIHMSYYFEYLKGENFWLDYVLNPLFKYFYPRIDHVINQCYGLEKNLISIIPKLKNKSTVIPCPIADYIIDFANKNSLNNIKKENYLLCVGRLVEQKAFHYAIEGFASIANMFPDLRLKIVGKGNLEKQLKQKAIDLKVANRVDFEGFQKNIIPYYLHAKATVLTSIYEGYPNVLIESIALNTPVVAFNCPSGPSEIIQEGLNGYLVDHQNVNDLKKKLITLLLNKKNNINLNNTIEKNKIAYVYKCYEQLVKSFINHY